jgi:hypothetical protein
VHVESEEGHGCRFDLHLKFQQATVYFDQHDQIEASLSIEKIGLPPNELLNEGEFENLKDYGNQIFSIR